MVTVLVKVQGSMSYKPVEAKDLAGVLKAVNVSADYQATDVDSNETLSSSSELKDGQRLLLTLKTKGA